ncbi:MAG TPA: CAP domain-containing protein [Planctomycetota bacterium]|nr:CAP domain-containing protein [Planctomycetota bacterium]
MGGKLTALAAAALELLALSLAPAASAARVVSEKPTLERNVVARINAVRKNHGLRPLRVVPRLVEAADRHAGSMARASYFRHELFTPSRPRTWTPFGTWIRWFWPGPGYSSWSAGENLAWGAPGITATQTVSRWMQSPGHRANILHPSWRNIGLGAVHVQDPTGYYGSWDTVTIVVAEFGRRS